MCNFCISRSSSLIRITENVVDRCHTDTPAGCGSHNRVHMPKGRCDAWLCNGHMSLLLSSPRRCTSNIDEALRSCMLYTSPHSENRNNYPECTIDIWTFVVCLMYLNRNLYSFQKRNRNCNRCHLGQQHPPMGKWLILLLSYQSTVFATCSWMKPIWVIWVGSFLFLNIYVLFFVIVYTQSAWDWLKKCTQIEVGVKGRKSRTWARIWLFFPVHPWVVCFSRFVNICMFKITIFL